MSENEPGHSGAHAPLQRAARNARASDREREQQSVEAVRHITSELVELVKLRGRVAVARAILARGGDSQDALDTLDGRRD